MSELLNPIPCFVAQAKHSYYTPELPDIKLSPWELAQNSKQTDALPYERSDMKQEWMLTPCLNVELLFPAVVSRNSSNWKPGEKS